MDGAQNLDRPLRVGDRRADQRLLVRTAAVLWRRADRRSTCSARRTGSWRSCRCESCTQWPSAPRGASWKPAPDRVGRPRCRIPLRVVVDAQLAGAPCSRPSASTQSSIFSASTCVSMPRAATRPSVEKSASGPTLELSSARASTSSLHPRVAGHVGDQHARERTDFHRLVVVARRLQPRVLAVARCRAARRAASDRCSSASVSPLNGCSARVVALLRTGTRSA